MLSSLENFSTEKTEREREREGERKVKNALDTAHVLLRSVYQHRLRLDHIGSATTIPTTNAIMAQVARPAPSRRPQANTKHAFYCLLSYWKPSHFIISMAAAADVTMFTFHFVPHQPPAPLVLLSSLSLSTLSPPQSTPKTVHLARWSIQLSVGLSMQIFLFASVFMQVKAGLTALAGIARLLCTL